MTDAVVFACRRARPILSFLALVILFAHTWTGLGVNEADAQTYYEPPRGSQERRAIMDAARVPVSGEIGSSVIFVVDVLRTDGRMAYLQAVPRNPDSSRIDWSKTRFREDWQADMMSDVVMVLLERQGGTWMVLEYVIGPTDVHWYGWLEPYGLPEALFFGG